MSQISPLAVVAPQAVLAPDVEIGPYCIIGPDVTIGSGCRLDGHVVITGHTQIGRNNRFHHHCIIGGEPQDYCYSGAPTRLIIGDDNVFREGVTVHRGAEKEDGITRIGSHCMFMVNVHIAHNCLICNHVILVNTVQLGGHVHVHEGAIISGGSVVHHFATIGKLAFVGGQTKVVVDIPPFMLAQGSDDFSVVTTNAVGLQRKGVPEDVQRVLKRAHRLLFREMRKLSETRQILASELGQAFPPELSTLLDFVQFQHNGKNGRGGEVRRNMSPAEIAALLREQERTGMFHIVEQSTSRRAA